MKASKRILTALLILGAILAGVFLAGRYGWKLLGFRACQGTGISSVEVSEGAVRITGFYPGSFPEGCIGYYAKEEDGKLSVGFRFSALFGFFETGDFDFTIPVKGDIHEVVLKTKMSETTLWTAEDGSERPPAAGGLDSKRENLCLAVTEDGRIVEGKHNEG